MAGVRQADRRFAWPAMLVSSFLPIPRAIIFVIVGWAGMRLVTFLVLDLIGVLLWAGMLAGLGYALGHHAVVAAQTVSHYGWWFTIGIVVLTVLFTLRSQRQLKTAVVAPPGAAPPPPDAAPPPPGAAVAPPDAAPTRPTRTADNSVRKRARSSGTEPNGRWRARSWPGSRR